MSWSKKRHFCEQVGELLSERRDTLDEAADFFAGLTVMGMLAFVACRQPKKPAIAASTTKAFSLLERALEIWPAGEDADSEAMPLKRWRAVPVMRVTLTPHDLPGKRYWRRVRATGSTEGEVEAPQSTCGI